MWLFERYLTSSHERILQIAACVCLVAVTSAMPTPATDDMTTDGMIKYLEYYQYVGKNHPDPAMRDMAETNMSMAVTMGLETFQQMHSRWGLKMTGEADEATMELMKRPRCGMPDIMDMGDMMRKRRKRYTLSGGTWQKKEITYTITQYPQDGDLTEPQVDEQVRLAFRVWEQVTALRFRRVDSSNTLQDIIIRFEPTIVDHGDGYPFDGPSGTLAHAFFPQGGDIGGDAHFDEAETWTVDTTEGFNLFLVAAHEFGHSLGLGHSGDPSALMAPFYAGYTPVNEFELSADDISGIQTKYGHFGLPVDPKPTVIPPPATQPTVRGKVPTTALPPAMVGACEEGIFDAITSMLIGNEHKTVAFRGDNYFMIEDGGVLPGYPKAIKDKWPELPSDIDAAVFLEAQFEHEWVYDEENKEWVWTRFETESANTLVFKGDQYWMMEQGQVKTGFPKNMATDLGFPTNIDAVFQWRRSGEVYIFKGENYYRYTDGVGIAEGYPRPVSVWGPMLQPVDTVFNHRAGNGSTVFFSGDQFFVYDDENFQIAAGYPLPTEPHWLKCDRYVSTANTYSVPMVCISVALFVQLVAFINVV